MKESLDIINAIPPWTLKLDSVQDYAYYENAFNDIECNEIIEYCRSLGLKTGQTLGGNVENIRKSKIAFVPPTEFMIPHYQKLTAIIHSLNSKFFDFDLSAFGEHLQFTQYEAPGGKYDSHVDRTINIPVRKLSIIVQLTDENDYEGGDVEWFTSIESPKIFPRKRGTVIAFPSYILHRVTPVTKGTRNSLVGWITGKQFR